MKKIPLKYKIGFIVAAITIVSIMIAIVLCLHFSTKGKLSTENKDQFEYKLCVVNGRTYHCSIPPKNHCCLTYWDGIVTSTNSGENNE